MSDLTKQQFDKWLHEIVAESTDGQRIQRRDCMTVDQECMAFEVWQASRECLVIELPELKINGTWHFFGFVLGFRAAKKMMRSLYEIELNKIGVKTK